MIWRSYRLEQEDEMKLFRSVVSPLQFQVVARVAAFFETKALQYSIDVDYRKPSDGTYVKGDTGFPAKGMPFQISVEIRTSVLVVDAYTNGVDGYEPDQGRYRKGGWEFRYEREDFDADEEMVRYVVGQLNERFEQL